MKKLLTPFEKWMVKSNLRTIREKRATAKQIIATLQANGYPRIADAVKAKIERQSTPVV
jgi:hypothetical protein